MGRVRGGSQWVAGLGLFFCSGCDYLLASSWPLWCGQKRKQSTMSVEIECGGGEVQKSAKSKTKADEFCIKIYIVSVGTQHALIIGCS